MVYGIYSVRLIAIILIVNAHLKEIYPHAIFSFGGGLGNSLFYFLSGYTLTLSQNKNALPYCQWLQKRFLKTIIPFVLYIGFVNIGSFSGFISQCMTLLIPHSLEQLCLFFPVLWLLYALFYPLHKLFFKAQTFILLLLLILTGILMIYISKTIHPIPLDLPTYSYLFALNGFVCFLSGMIMCNQKLIKPEFPKIGFSPAMGFGCSIIACQVLKAYLTHKIDFLIPIGYYLNLASVLLIFLAFRNLDLGRYRTIEQLIATLAKSSLAVFVIHFHIIGLVKTMNLSFPYSVIMIYLYSFIIAFVLTIVGEKATDLVFKYTKQRLIIT